MLGRISFFECVFSEIDWKLLNFLLDYSVSQRYSNQSLSCTNEKKTQHLEAQSVTIYACFGKQVAVVIKDLMNIMLCGWWMSFTSSGDW